jgi:glycosyltransferase involved in cell wall biosynthesis
LVSICIPTYNQTIYLEKLMQSIVEQEYQDFEVVVSDDSTTEDVFKLVERYKTQLPDKIRYYRNSPSLGSPANWNYAISKANHEFIHLIHHDDYYTNSNSLKEMINLATNSNACWFYGQVHSHNTLTNNVAPFVIGESDFQDILRRPLKILLNNKLGPPSSLFFHKTHLVEFDPELIWLVDVEFYFRLIKKCRNVRISMYPFITSINNSSTNLTRLYQDNPRVEINEYLYIFNKLNISLLNYPGKYAFIRKLFRKYGVFSFKQAREFIDKKYLTVIIKMIIVHEKIRFWLRLN